MLDEIFKPNASNFAIILEYKNHIVFIHIDQEIKLHKMTSILVFVFQKYGKYGNVSLKHFIKHKPLISEECNISKIH